MEKKIKCCICGKEFIGWGNNPWPVKEEGICCDKCNWTKVIPARVAMLSNRGYTPTETNIMSRSL